MNSTAKGKTSPFGALVSKFSEVSVYAVLDVSGSMQGSKIEELCKSVTDIIASCPDNVLFEITLFHSRAIKIYNGSKALVNVNSIVEEIKRATLLGKQTALYDAWGDMLTGIPKTVLSNNLIQICVLTDGEDNASVRHTYTSVTELTKSLLAANINFNYIQVGSNINTALHNSLKQIAAISSEFKTQKVDDSAKGIHLALSSVRSDILLSVNRASNQCKLDSSKQSAKALDSFHGLFSSLDLNNDNLPSDSTSSNALTKPHPLLTSRRVQGSTSGLQSLASNINPTLGLVSTSGVEMSTAYPKQELLTTTKSNFGNIKTKYK